MSTTYPMRAKLSATLVAAAAVPVASYAQHGGACQFDMDDTHHDDNLR